MVTLINTNNQYASAASPALQRPTQQVALPQPTQQDDHSTQQVDEGQDEDVNNDDDTQSRYRRPLHVLRYDDAPPDSSMSASFQQLVHGSASGGGEYQVRTQEHHVRTVSVVRREGGTGTATSTSTSTFVETPIGLAAFGNIPPFIIYAAYGTEFTNHPI
jgi:hypothetical protein